MFLPPAFWNLSPNESCSSRVLSAHLGLFICQVRCALTVGHSLAMML